MYARHSLHRRAFTALAAACGTVGVHAAVFAAPRTDNAPMLKDRRDGHHSLFARTCGDVLVVAHRGRLTLDQVENSLGQIIATTQSHDFMVEFDVRQSRDGDLYLLHDATLDRTTTGSGPIAERSNIELQSIRLRSPTGPTVEAIPRFEDLARWASTVPNAKLMVDLKNADPVKVVALLDRYGLAQRSLMLTFDDKTAQAALAFEHDVIVSVLVGTNAQIDSYAAVPAKRLAFYVSQDAPTEVFTHARTQGVLVISDALMPVAGGALDERAERDGPNAYRSFFDQRKIDILVTNHAAAACRALSH